jgi:hypothetical protein
MRYAHIFHEYFALHKSIECPYIQIIETQQGGSNNSGTKGEYP